MSTPGRVPSPSRAPDAAGLIVSPWLIAFMVSIATFMEVMDTSIANVALPHIAGGLAVSVDESTWVLTSYLVANAIVLPMSGWFANTFGRKRFYLTCVGVFMVSSGLCGLAPNLKWLILFRVLQGMGGGGLQPSSLAILVDTFPQAKRGMAMAVYGVSVVVAPILGPTLGGWITDNAAWRWIFYINVPAGCLSLLLNGLWLRDPPHLVAARTARRGTWRIDYIGVCLLALGLGSLEVVYSRGQRLDWFESGFIVALSVVAVVSLVGVVLWELRRREPVVNLRLFKDRNYAASCLIMFGVFASLFGTLVLLPEMLQILMGYTATDAGLVMSPGGIATMLVMPVAGWLLARRVDARWLMMLGLLIVAGALYWLSGITLQMSAWHVVVVRSVQMLGMGFIFVPVTTIAYSFIPKEQTNNATALFSLVRNEAGSFGVAFVTTLLERRAQLHQFRLSEHVTPLNPMVRERLKTLTGLTQATGVDAATARHQALGRLYETLQQQAQLMSYVDLFWLASMATLASLPLLLLLRRVPKNGTTARESAQV